MVAHHDLRTVVAARAPGPVGPLPPADAQPQAYRDAAAAAVAELARRESAQCDVGVSDVLATIGAGAAHTINHPGNPVLAQRVQSATCRTSATLAASCWAACGHRWSPGCWQRVQSAASEVVGAGSVHQQQAAFYRADPGWLDAAEARHAERMALLGLPVHRVPRADGRPAAG